MSKIICDVCGTAFPENTAQCPICGSAKPISQDVLSADDSTAGYNSVKGGRFSKSNVRKRNKAMMANQAVQKHGGNEKGDDKQGEGRGLVIAVIVLLIAIFAVAAYIFFRFFAPTLIGPKDTEPTNPSHTETTTPTEPTIPCTDIEISASVVELDKVGRAQLLTISVSPENTTDEVTFASSNPEIAAVLPEGRIVAVGQGVAVITITCGDIVKECEVYCNFDGTLNPPTQPEDTQPTTSPTEPAIEPTTEPTTAPTTEPTTPPTTEPVSKIKLNREDFTLFSAGSGWTLYAGEIDKADVKFYSANEAVATFVNGRVTAVGPGKTTVYAEYNGEKQSCIVRCSFKVEETTPPTTEQTTPPATEETQPTEAPEEPTYAIAINGLIQTGSSVTFPLDEAFDISLVDEDNQKVDVQWTSSDSNICAINNNRVKPVFEGEATLSVTYKQKSYSIKIVVEGGASG